MQSTQQSVDAILLALSTHVVQEHTEVTITEQSNADALSDAADADASSDQASDAEVAIAGGCETIFVPVTEQNTLPTENLSAMNLAEKRIGNPTER